MQHNLDISSGITRTNKVIRLVSRIGWLNVRGQKNIASQELVQGMQELGGIYIKFLQVIANLAPDFPGLTPSIAHSVFDASSFQDVNIFETLDRNLNHDQRQRIGNVQALPLASGSFAQVYAATIDADKPVVIKVLRPHIREQLKTDLRLLGLIARAAQPLIRSDIVSTTKVYKDYKQTVLHEIRYQKEVEYAEEMSLLYAHNKKIVIPFTYRELCTSEIIVQEKLEGIPLSSLLRQTHGDGSEVIKIVKEQLDSDVIDQLSEFGYSLISSAIEGPYMYGDPHPGNIILMSGGRVGIVDFGVLLPRISNPYDLYDVLANESSMHYDQNNTTDIAEHIVKVFKLYNPRVYRALERIDIEIRSTSIVQELTKVIDTIIEPSKQKIRDSYTRGLGIPTRMIMDALNGKDGNNRFGMMAYEPTARLARAQSQFWKTAEQLGIVRETSVEVHRKLKEKFEGIKDTLKQDNTMTFSEASEILTDWFTELMQRDPLLFGQVFAKIRKTLQDYEKEPRNA